MRKRETAAASATATPPSAILGRRKLVFRAPIRTTLLCNRCFWFISVFSIFSTAWLLTWLLYKRFEEMPTRITIENQYESARNVPYPSIAICSPNQITTKALEHLNRTLVDGNRTMDLETVLPNLLGFYEIIDNLDHASLSQFENLIEMNRYHAIEVMGMLPQRCEDFLKLCILEGQLYPRCKTLFHPILTDRGLCCIFNSVYRFKRNKSQIQSQIQFGSRNENELNFTIRRTKNVGAIASLRVIADFEAGSAVDGTIVNSGALRVMVMQWSEFPAVDESRLVHPRTESFHVIHPTYTYCSEEVSSLPAFSRKCYFTNEVPVRFFREYYNSDCDLLCHVREIERQCHCIMIYIPHVRVEGACKFTNIECIINVKVQMSNWYKNEDCDCPRDCVSFRYRVEMTIGNLKALPHLANDPYGSVIFNKSTSLLHFYFPKSVYVKQKQETVMSLISLFSNLGGIFGLCMGCSVISVFEIFFYIYSAFRNKIKNRARIVTDTPPDFIN